MRWTRIHVAQFEAVGMLSTLKSQPTIPNPNMRAPSPQLLNLSEESASMLGAMQDHVRVSSQGGWSGLLFKVPVVLLSAGPVLVIQVCIFAFKSSVRWIFSKLSVDGFP